MHHLTNIKTNRIPQGWVTSYLAAALTIGCYLTTMQKRANHPSSRINVHKTMQVLQKSIHHSASSVLLLVQYDKLNVVFLVPP
jgi:hypothetical protein